MDKCMDVNMTVCAWCGEANGIAIGKKLVDCKNKWDTKMVFGGYEPCSTCQEYMDQGFVLMEANDYPNQEGQPEMQDGVYPTGRYWVIDREAAKRAFPTAPGDKCFIDPEVAEKMGLNNMESRDGN